MRTVTLNTSGQSSKNAFAALARAVHDEDVRVANNLRKTAKARAANKARRKASK